MEEIKKPLYAYIKGDKYKTYKIYREEDEELKKINQEFDDFSSLIDYVYRFSNWYSIPIQFYM